MSRTTTHRPTPEQLQFRRDHLARIEHALRFREELDQLDRLALMRVLRELLDGRDPRVDLGIPPKRGARSIKGGYHAWIAGHYWHLRMRQGEKDVAARAAVGSAWGVSASQVWNVARPLRTEWARRFASGEFDKIMNTVDSLIPHFKQLSANSR